MRVIERETVGGGGGEIVCLREREEERARKKDKGNREREIYRESVFDREGGGR